MVLRYYSIHELGIWSIVFGIDIPPATTIRVRRALKTTSLRAVTLKILFRSVCGKIKRARGSGRYDFRFIKNDSYETLIQTIKRHNNDNNNK